MTKGTLTPDVYMYISCQTSDLTIRSYQNVYILARTDRYQQQVIPEYGKQRPNMQTSLFSRTDRHFIYTKCKWIILVKSHMNRPNIQATPYFLAIYASVYTRGNWIFNFNYPLLQAALYSRTDRSRELIDRDFLYTRCKWILLMQCSMKRLNVPSTLFSNNFINHLHEV